MTEPGSELGTEPAALAPAKKARSGPAPTEDARRAKGDFKSTLRMPGGPEAEAVRKLVKEHGGLASAMRWLLRQVGLLP